MMAERSMRAVSDDGRIIVTRCAGSWMVTGAFDAWGYRLEPFFVEDAPGLRAGEVLKQWQRHQSE